MDGRAATSPQASIETVTFLLGLCCKTFSPGYGDGNRNPWPVIGWEARREKLSSSRKDESGRRP